MPEYEFVIEKTQTTVTKRQAEDQEVLGDILDTINVDELEFNPPRYNLKAIFKISGKISELIWRRP